MDTAYNVSWIDVPEPISYETGDVFFEDWEIRGKLGHGSSGSVYLLGKELAGIEQEAAMKVVRLVPDPSRDEMLRSMGQSNAMIASRRQEALSAMVREISVMMALRDHPNVVRCDDFKVFRISGEDNWDIQIKMEKLTSLQSRMAKGELTEEEAIRVGRDICRALAACEQYDLIHRDIKPANLFAGAMGQFKLGDFGSARAQASGSSMTQKAGTELYMAPEVMHSSHYDHRVDIYSLGLVLYQLANGNRLPFYPEPGKITPRAMEEAWEKRMRGDEMPAPAGVDGAVAQAILKACAHKPEDRYETAAAFAEALERAASGAPQAAPAQEVPTAEALLTRAQLMQEDGEWEKANEYAERVLDLAPQTAAAYVVKLCVARKAHTLGELAQTPWASMADDPNYRKALRFADAGERQVLEDTARLAGLLAKTEAGAGHQPPSPAASGKDTAQEPPKPDLSKYAEGDVLTGRVRRIEPYGAFVELEPGVDGLVHISRCAAQPVEKVEDAVHVGDVVRAKVMKVDTDARRIDLSIRDALPAPEPADNAPAPEPESSAPVPAAPKGALKPGDAMRFGRYAQDGVGKPLKAIDWIVLETNGTTAKLISKYVLGASKYDGFLGASRWEGSELRKYLNGTFLNEAFSKEERDRLVPMEVTAAKNPKYSTNPGRATRDKVAVLSMQEAEQYLPQKADRVGMPTKIARERGVDSGVKKEDSCYWWLRNPGGNRKLAAMVDPEGEIGDFGYVVNAVSFGFRPVICLELEKKPSGKRRTVTFGQYMQEMSSPKKSPIEWMVLEEQTDRVLLLSRYGLATQPYSLSRSSVSWGDCSLRYWLNSLFLKDVFSQEEQLAILPVRPEPGMEGTDWLFLLSKEEAGMYLASPKERECQPSLYAAARGARSHYGLTDWWLRTSRPAQQKAVYVDTAGGLDSTEWVENATLAVRPAMWVKKSALPGFA